MESHSVIGTMSGSSHDGLDIAHCIFDFDNSWSFQIDHARTIPYPKPLRQRLLSAPSFSGYELSILDLEYGMWCGENIQRFLTEYGINPLLVASHGHTIFHTPEDNLTKQIGNATAMVNIIQKPVISDFRSLDVLLGGQGAPLVPVGDELLFPNYDFCINLGGIANFSYSGKNGRNAWDLCPFNIILDHLANKLGQDYDESGRLASGGKLSKDFADELNNMPYYLQSPPKSLDKKAVEDDFLTIIDGFSEEVGNKLYTFVDHTAGIISRAIINSDLTTSSGKILLTGGGAYNTFFVEKLREKLARVYEVVLPDKKIIEFKEAMIFALLGVLRWKGEVNCLASATGASRDSSGGTIHMP